MDTGEQPTGTTTARQRQIRIISMEPATEELYAVFLGGKSGKPAWEERAMFMVTYEERWWVMVDGIKYRTKWRTCYGTSSASLPETPHQTSEAFVGLRPVGMPRQDFAKEHLQEFEAALYVKTVTAAWSVASEDLNVGE